MRVTHSQAPQPSRWGLQPLVCKRWTLPPTSQSCPATQVDMYHFTTSSSSHSIHHRPPTVTFTYDLSPMQVVVTEEREAFASFLTQICAIIGGVFTVTGLLDSVVYHAISGAKKLS